MSDFEKFISDQGLIEKNADICILNGKKIKIGKYTVTKPFGTYVLNSKRILKTKLFNVIFIKENKNNHLLQKVLRNETNY